jgi:hypothetical protein
MDVTGMDSSPRSCTEYLGSAPSGSRNRVLKIVAASVSGLFINLLLRASLSSESIFVKITMTGTLKSPDERITIQPAYHNSPVPQPFFMKSISVSNRARFRLVGTQYLHV